MAFAHACSRSRSVNRWRTSPGSWNLLSLARAGAAIELYPSAESCLLCARARAHARRVSFAAEFVYDRGYPPSALEVPPSRAPRAPDNRDNRRTHRRAAVYDPASENWSECLNGRYYVGNTYTYTRRAYVRASCDARQTSRGTREQREVRR